MRSLCYLSLVLLLSACTNLEMFTPPQLAKAKATPPQPAVEPAGPLSIAHLSQRYQGLEQSQLRLRLYSLQAQQQDLENQLSQVSIMLQLEPAEAEYPKAQSLLELALLQHPEFIHSDEWNLLAQVLQQGISWQEQQQQAQQQVRDSQRKQRELQAKLQQLNSIEQQVDARE